MSEHTIDIEVDEIEDSEFDKVLVQELRSNNSASYIQVLPTQDLSPAIDHTASYLQVPNQDLSPATSDRIDIPKEIITPMKAAAAALTNLSEVRATNDNPKNCDDSEDSIIAAWNADHTKGPPDTSNQHRSGYDEAWEYIRFINGQKKITNEKTDNGNDHLTFNIDCQACYGNVPGIIQALDNKQEMEYKFGTRMFCTSFINSFVQLLAHDSHTMFPPPLYRKSDIVVKCVSCSSPTSPPQYVKVLDTSVTDLVTIAFNDTHFVVLRFVIRDHTVTVHDGLNFSIKKWTNHVVRVLKEYSLVTSTSIPVINDTTNEDGCVVMRISFGSESNEWTMKRVLVKKQVDGISCGPLACYRLLEICGYEEESSYVMIHQHYTAMRLTVMSHWTAMIDRNRDNLYALFTKHKYEQVRDLMTASEDQSNVNTKLDEKLDTKFESENDYDQKNLQDGINHEGVKDFDVEEGYDKSDIGLDHNKERDDAMSKRNALEEGYDKSDIGLDHNKERDDAMSKRNARQEQLAMKAMKQYAEGVKSKGATCGAIVTLKVDHRVHSHPYGLLGVVYKAAETGGILVVCEHGVITSSGTNKDFWVPNDQYKVVARADESAAITDNLQRVRESVMNGNYNYVEQPRISYAKYHDIIIQSTSPTKRGRCSCKKGCKRSTCGCLKKNLTCHSGCGCNGNCEIEK